MATPPSIYQLKITLDRISPFVWRSFQVRSDIKLTRLHETIQIVMGWQNCHLYSFHVDGTTYTDPASVEDDIYDMGYRDGSKVKLFKVFEWNAEAEAYVFYGQFTAPQGTPHNELEEHIEVRD